ncbi:tyrosine-type recombinase/integrase [Marinobacter antarcticus]|uniref:tyrosine-type recombinase/integrase n=1 Tax=Marinobacter antarcticus TaxID=564117 RepID=UPI002265C6EC|nr:tyrosine-type recombinase/integrase [Marinobacter antarcticus]
MTRQVVSANIDRLIEQVGGEAPFKIGCQTFRHSFAVHLLLHGRPLKFVSQLLGHRSVESTEVYTNVLTFDGAHFLEGVDFHQLISERKWHSRTKIEIAKLISESLSSRHPPKLATPTAKNGKRK